MSVECVRIHKVPLDHHPMQWELLMVPQRPIHLTRTVGPNPAAPAHIMQVKTGTNKWNE